LIAVEAAGRRIAFLRGDFVLTDIPVRELARDLELDRHKVVAADLPRAARRDE
jgi:hypothetical protein